MEVRNALSVLFIMVMFSLFTLPCSGYEQKQGYLESADLVAEVLGDRNISGLDTIQFVISNVASNVAGYTGDAYNVTIWLEGAGENLENHSNVEVISGKAFFERIPASSIFELSFPVLVKSNISMKFNLTVPVNLTLHITYYKMRFYPTLTQNSTQNSTGLYNLTRNSAQNLTQNSVQNPVKTPNRNLTSNLTFERVEKQMRFTFNIVPPSLPKIEVIASKETFYAGEPSNLQIYLVNDGSLARNVTARLISQSLRILPKFSVIPAIPSAYPTSIVFQIEKETPGNVVVGLNLSYEYFNGTKWVERKERQNLLLRFENRSRDVLDFPDRLEMRKDEKKKLSIQVFNPYEYPIVLKLELRPDQGIVLERKRFYVELMPGETRSVSLGVTARDAGERKIEVNSYLTVLAPYQKEESFGGSLRISITPEPELEVRAVNSLTSEKEDQVLKLLVKNTGEMARDIRITLKPSVGIPVRIHDTFVEELRKGEERTVKFRVDVGRLPPQNYSMEAVILYRDPQGNVVEKNTIFSVSVLPASEFRIEHAEIVGILVVILLLALIAKRK